MSDPLTAALVFAAGLLLVPPVIALGWALFARSARDLTPLAFLLALLVAVALASL